MGNARFVFTLDNHFIRGGQGDTIGAALAAISDGPRPRLVQIGVNGIPACGTNYEVLAHHGLDAAGLTAIFTQQVI